MMKSRDIVAGLLTVLAVNTPALGQPRAGGHEHGAAAPVPHGAGRMTLVALRDAGFVEVTLEASRFQQDQVATIRIVNKLDVAVTGEIPACATVFEPADAGRAVLVPAESGRFVVGPSQTVQLTRPFRALDESKRPAEGAAYRLSADPYDHDLSRCREG